jgi:D-tyrosyl-tRNA(Tyr) deacylase
LRALIQRVSRASVAVDGRSVGEINRGLVVLLGVGKDDDDEDARHIVEKTVNLRIFPDSEGRFDRSALDVSADLLVVSQFTLYGDTRKGRRPSFVDAAPPEDADALFQSAVQAYRDTGLRVETGVFQTHMVVSIVNDGPVTIWLDSADRRRPRRG